MGQSNDHTRRDAIIKVLLGLLLVTLVIVDFHLLWTIWTEGTL